MDPIFVITLSDVIGAVTAVLMVSGVSVYALYLAYVNRRR